MDVLILLSQGGRVYQDAQMIDASHAMLIEVEGYLRARVPGMCVLDVV